MNKLPASMKEYFWDVDFDNLSVEADSFFITKRVLDRGNLENINWVILQYGNDKIKEVLTTSRDLSRKTANFWAQILNIAPQNVPCLKKPYSPIHFGLSS